MKKTFFLSLLFSLQLTFAIGQLKLPGAGNKDFKQALEQVLNAFPQNFAAIKGEVVMDEPQRTAYASTVIFPSAIDNTIFQHAGKKPVFTWQANLLATEDFETAAKKYKAIFKDLKGMNLTLNRDYDYTLTGTYDVPDESKGFAETTFRLMPAATNLSKVLVSLLLDFEFPEWKISMQVYQKEREDGERGKIND